MEHEATPRPVINWGRVKLNAFKRAHSYAVRNERQSFKFEGHEFLTSYARYLIEYLESKLL